MASIRRRHSRLSSGWRRPLVAGTVSRRRFSGVASDRPGGSGHARDGMPSADQGPTRDGRSPAGGRHEAMAIIKASGPLVHDAVELAAARLSELGPLLKPLLELGAGELLFHVGLQLR